MPDPQVKMAFNAKTLPIKR